MRNWRVTLSYAITLCCSVAVAQETNQKGGGTDNSGARYRALEVGRFEVAEGVKISTKEMTTLTAELVAQLKKTERFDQVVLEGGNTSPAGHLPTLHLSGGVKYFNKKEHSLTLEIVLSDQETGQVLYKEEVRNNGSLFGERVDLKRGVARRTAIVVAAFMAFSSAADITSDPSGEILGRLMKDLKKDPYPGRRIGIFGFKLEPGKSISAVNSLTYGGGETFVTKGYRDEFLDGPLFETVGFAQGVSDSSGHFTFSSLPAGIYWLYMDLGYGRGSSIVKTLESDSPLLIELTPGQHIDIGEILAK